MYESLFRQAPTRSLIVAPGEPFNILDASDSYLDATLTTREIIGRPMFEVFPDNPDDPGADGVRELTGSFERALRGRATDLMPVQKYDIRNRSARFVERFWTPINAAVVGEEGTPRTIVHSVEDVTAFVREGEILRGEAADLRHQILVRARDLAALNGALRESIEYRRRIIAIVGHDLRNPLTAIRNGVGLLSAHFNKLGVTPPNTIKVLQSATGQMEGLLRDLDDYVVSQIRGVLPVSREWVNVRDLCDDAVRATQLARPDRTVELESGDAIGAYVDPKRTRQLVTNLLINALDHGAQDRPVRVSMHRATGGCVITVSNEGTPIPRDMVPSLFEPFRRGPGSGTAHQRGHMGLGLYIVQQIVHAHEGRIDVESTERGTHFTVFIPIG